MVVSANRRIYAAGGKFSLFDDTVDEIGREFCLDHFKKFGEDNSLHGLIARCFAEPKSFSHDRTRNDKGSCQGSRTECHRSSSVGSATNGLKLRQRCWSLFRRDLTRSRPALHHDFRNRIRGPLAKRARMSMLPPLRPMIPATG